MAKRTGIMLPQPFTEELFNRLPKPCIVQPKLEGDRLRAIPTHGSILLRTSSDKPRVSVPHIHQALMNYGLKCELDGELYVHGMAHSDIRKIVSRTMNIHPDYRKMEYHVYDIVDPDMDQRERLHRLREMVLYGFIKYVPWFYVYDLEKLQIQYDEFLDQGYEGIIIRHPDRPYKRTKVPWMLKLKPRLSGAFRIVGVEPLVNIAGEVQQTMGSFSLEDDEGRTFSVGTGPTKEDRLLFWDFQHKLRGRYCKIRFQGYTKANNVPKMQSIDKDWLVEMRKELR